MKFIHPGVFLLIPVLFAAVVMLAVAAGRRRKELLGRLLGAAAADPRAVRVSYAKRRWRIVFLLLAMSALAAAAARPYWSTRLLPSAAGGRDVMVLFDVSKSMRAADPAPSRLEHAKFLLRQLVSDLAGDRFGLVAFAGTAYLACPLTGDTLAFEQYINELDPDMVPLGGTNLELALSTAQKAFQAASSSNRAIVLFSDGDELSGNARRQLTLLKNRNIPLLVVGLGNPDIGSPIPEGNGTMKRDRAGNLVTTKLNENMLRQLAENSGGVYVRSTVTAPGLSVIEARLERLETSSQGRTKRSVPEERFPLPLAAAALFFTVYLLLSEKPFRKALPGILLGTALLLTGASAPVPQENRPVPEEKLPEVPEALYNTARARQQKGDASAEALYEEVMKKAPGRPDLQSRSLQNLGVSLHNRARNEIKQSAVQVRQQQLDGALQKLDAAGKILKDAEELYVRSLSLPEAELKSASINLQRLEQDRKRIEELKKKIEELKKQQKKAQQQAQQAQQQNKHQNKQQNQQKQNQPQKQQQGQNKQNQPQNQQGQNKQDPQQKQQQNQQRQNKQGQPQKQQQNKQQNQQGQNKQNQPQNPQDAVDKAREAAKELARQAGDLQQQKLKEQAERASRELEKAKEEQKKQNPEQAQKHLDEAVKALGAPDQQKPDPKKDQQGQKPLPRPEPQKGQGKEEKKTIGAAGKEAPKAPDRKSGEQLLKLLKDEENRRRGDLRRDVQGRRPAVEKDW